MRCGRRKHGSDCISRLPANIVDSILGWLPLHDAVRTSVLSTDWRNRWKSVPKLVFDFHFNLSNHKLDSIIYHVLLQHRGHISKFALQVFTSAAGPDIDSWLPLIPSARLQDFSLHLYPCSKQLLSPHFFCFHNLHHLNLYRCVFRPPPRFRGFTKLITLDFQEVDLVPAAFEHFLSLCLVLERVRLVGCTSFDSFEVEAPCLKFFSFQGVFKCIHFHNSPALAEVSLGIHMAVVEETPMMEGFEYFQFVSTLQTLYLHPRVLEFMDAGDQFPESFDSLKYIDVSMYLDSVNEISCALRLIKNSPHLERLQISLYACKGVEGGVEGGVMGFILGQETPDVELNHIRRVRIAVFASVGGQIEFVRYVLAAAAKLEQLVIAPAFSAAIPDHALMEQLRRLPRASPAARIFVVRRLRRSFKPLLTRLLLIDQIVGCSAKWETAQGEVEIVVILDKAVAEDR